MNVAQMQAKIKITIQLYYGILILLSHQRHTEIRPLLQHQHDYEEQTLVHMVAIAL